MRNDINTIYHTYGNTLYRIAYSYLKSEHDALDIIQNVLYKFYTKNPIILSQNHLKNYLIKMVINECNDHLKKQSRLHLDSELIEAIPDEINHYHHITLEDLLDTLEENYRIVFVLYYLEELSVDEISKILTISSSAVKMRLKRGREILKERWEENGFNQEGI